MKKVKTVLEYCANCDEEFEMPIVQRDASNPHLFWVRCPKCNETKPVDIAQISDDLHEEPDLEDDLLEEETEPIPEEALDEEELEEIIPPVPISEKKLQKKKTPRKKRETKEDKADSTQIFKIQRERAREYHPGESFQPGETILHPKWKEYGVVLRVRRSGGGRTMMEVRFEKSGDKKLLINQKLPSGQK